MAADSTPLGGRPAPPPAAPAALRLRPANLRLVAALFFLFLAVVSEPFSARVIGGFGPKARLGGRLTAWGVVLQGLFLVLGYLGLAALTEHGVL
jgi:hypothetical protein